MCGRGRSAFEGEHSTTAEKGAAGVEGLYDHPILHREKEGLLPPRREKGKSTRVGGEKEDLFCMQIAAEGAPPTAGPKESAFEILSPPR